MTETKNGAPQKIIQAFNKLVLSRRRGRPRITEVVNEAGVARSTVYEHFGGKDGVLLEALKGPLSIIADASTGDNHLQRLEAILDHFRDKRADAIEIISGRLMAHIVRLLAELIEDRMATDSLAHATALHIADAQLGFIRLWLADDTRYSTATLAKLMQENAKMQCAFFSRQTCDAP